MVFFGEKANNKDKKAAGGNWGHPRPFVKKHTNVPEIDDEPPRRRAKRKNKKKPKKKLIYEGHICPHCNHPLELLETKRFFVFETTEDVCRKCGAKKGECPCCHRESWEKDGYFIHNRSFGCSFRGYKKVI